MLLAVMMFDPAGYWKLLRGLFSSGFFDGIKGFYPP